MSPTMVSYVPVTDSRTAGGPDRPDHPREAQADILPERRLRRRRGGRQRRRGGVYGGQVAEKGAVVLWEGEMLRVPHNKQEEPLG